MRDLLARHRQRLMPVVVAPLALLLALALAACGDDDSTTGGDGDTTSASSSIVAEAQQKVEEYENPSLDWPGPNDPVKTPEGQQELGVVPCGPYEGCLLAAEGAVDAGEALGWKVSMVTPNVGTPNEVNAIFQRLIDSGVDAISWVGVPRAVLGPSLKLAEENDVPMVSAQASDGDPLDVPFGDPSAPTELLGEQIAWWMVQDSNGEAQVAILSDDEFVTGVQIDKGFEAVMEQCDGCDVVDTVDITAAEEANVAPTETANILSRNPDVDYLFAPFESRVAYLIQGARQAQRDDVKIGATAGLPEELEAEDSPKLNVSTGLPQEWSGWATVDQILRIMSDQPLVEDYKIPVKLTTPENVDEPWFPPISETDAIDYQAEFKQLWGVE